MFEVELVIQWASQWQVSFSTCTALDVEIIFSGEIIFMNNVLHQVICISKSTMWLPSVENLFLKKSGTFTKSKIWFSMIQRGYPIYLALILGGVHMFTCSGTTDNWLCAIITILRKEITCLGDRNMPRDDKVGIQCHPIAAIASRFFSSIPSFCNYRD